MRSLLGFFLLLTTLALGQTVTTPNSQDIPVGVSGLPINGFNLSGYNPSTVYKVSLSLTGNSGGTFSVTSTSGLTRDFGYNSWTNITSVNFTGTPGNIQNGLNSIKLNTTSIVDRVMNLSVVIASQVANTYYNPANGHMYKFVPGQYTVTQARTGALNSTFEGEPGYLVNITSATEQNFINTKVSAFNVWIGLQDATQEGVWRWMDGPEAGQISSYYTWCSGEPNNWGSGEDYVVTRWGGGGCWNDFGPPATTSAGSIGGYIVEYGTWTDPTQSTFNSTQNVQITFTQKDMLWVDYKFNFGNGINPTDYSGLMYYEQSANTWGTNNSQTLTLNSTGNINVTNQIQETPVGKKATTTGGQVEWLVIYNYDSTNKRYRIGIDKREFPSGFNFTQLTHLQLFDIFDDEIEYKSDDAYWAEYYWYTPTNYPWSTSAYYNTYMRNGGSFMAFKAEISFVDMMGYKPQSFIFQSPSQAVIETMIDDIVTVSDVVLAFNELAYGGINGGFKGDLNGIQLQNADINGDNQFDFEDTYLLLNHLEGTPFVQSTESLVHFMKIKETSLYNSITSQNWQSKFNATTLMAPISIDLNNLVTFPNFSVTWKGDINLSHSPAQYLQVQGVRMNRLNLSRYIEPNLTEIYLDIKKQEDMLIVHISIPNNNNNITGSQFRLVYDYDKVKYVKTEYSNTDIRNFTSDKLGYVSVGSISINGTENLNTAAQYTVYFKLNQNIENILGLISLMKTELVTREGTVIQSIVK